MLTDRTLEEPGRIADDKLNRRLVHQMNGICYWMNFTPNGYALGEPLNRRERKRFSWLSDRKRILERGKAYAESRQR